MLPTIWDGAIDDRPTTSHNKCHSLDTFPLTTAFPAKRCMIQQRSPLRGSLLKQSTQLPQAQRQTLQLQLHDDLTYSEVAQRLGISIGTVMSRLFYARNRLRELLSPHIMG